MNNTLSQLKNLAEQGDKHAQFELGQYFDFGKNVEQDFTQAKFWYQKSEFWKKNLPKIVCPVYIER